MGLTADLRFAFRTLAKSPLFSLVAIVSLALGIGANTAVFSLMDQLLLRMLPVKDPARLVELAGVGTHYGSNRGVNAMSYPMYADFRDRNPVFEGMFCTYQTPISVSFGGRTERAGGELVSGTYFPVLGVKAAVGRVFTPDEDKTPEGEPYAVLGYDYWLTRFGGDPEMVGKQILVNGRRLTVIGVAARGFDGVEHGFSTQIFMPVAMQKPIMAEGEDLLKKRRERWINVFGRLKPGVSATQAKAALQPIFHNMLVMEVAQPEFAKTSAYTRQQFLRMTLDVLPGGGGHSMLAMFLQTPMTAMMAMVGLVLLIACANVASLMVARAVARQKEIALRLALGAGRMRIARQLVVESVLLSLAGGALGLTIASGTVSVLIGILPQTEPPLQISANLDSRMLLFTLAVSLGTGIFFGLIPALQATKPDLAPVLKEQAGAVAGGGAQVNLRKVLVAAQVALSLLLLIAAGLFARTLKNLRNVRPGFAVDNVLSMKMDATLSGYAPERAKNFYKELTASMNATPGVESAAVSLVPLLNFDEWDETMTVEGYAPKPGEDMGPWTNYIGPGYFATLQIPVLEGTRFHAPRRREGAEGSDRESKLRAAFLWPEQRDRAAYRRRRRSGDEDGHRNRGRGEGRGVSQRAGRDSARGLFSVPAAEVEPGDDGLREDGPPFGADVPGAAGGGAQAGRESAGVWIANAGQAAGRFVGDRAVDRDAVERVRIAGDDAGGDRAVRRDGVSGRAADEGDRHTAGAGRGGGRSAVAGDA